jgi:hypothetical protein
LGLYTIKVLRNKKTASKVEMGEKIEYIENDYICGIKSCQSVEILILENIFGKTKPFSAVTIM